MKNLYPVVALSSLIIFIKSRYLLQFNDELLMYIDVKWSKMSLFESKVETNDEA